jgi:hypothetical protein
MSNQGAVVFDTPQNRLSTPPPVRQSAEWCEKQQISAETSFAADISGRAERSLLAFYKQPRPHRDFAAQLRYLQRHYTFLDSDSAISELFETEPALYSLLIEAVEPLQRAFGDKTLVYARIQSADEDRILKVAVRLPANFGDNPEDALQNFDNKWWLYNCHRSGGALIFDYEM